MPAVDIDRQAIERRDFPIARRGYEPAAVDAHLRALAAEIEQLQRELSDGPPASLASTAGTQVQSILAAAEATAAELERDAAQDARTTREDAAGDAASTREKAIAQARGQVAFVAQATAALLERVASMDAEVSALVQSVREGANRLAGDLRAVEENMGELYDAASGTGVTRAVSTDQAAQPSIPVPPAPVHPAPHAAQPPVPPPAAARAAAAPAADAAAAPATPTAPATPAAPPQSPPEVAEPDVHVDPEAPPPRERIASGGASSASAPAGGDLDSARLVALNMALNGDSRDETDRYLAENFQLADRAKLISEVYAAIEA